MSSKKRRIYTEAFKKQMVTLYKSGKPPSELIEEYDLSPSSIYQWRKKYSTKGNAVSGNDKEPIDELKKLREENTKLKMEVDILKQARLHLYSKEFRCIVMR